MGPKNEIGKCADYLCIPGIKVHAKTALVHRRIGLINEFYGVLGYREL